MALFTTGYEGLNISQFIEQLHMVGVETLIDVRQLPLSRKKGFSKTALRSELEAHGINYEHLPALGCPKEVRDRYKVDSNWSQYKIDYNNHLKVVKSEIELLAERSCEEDFALMCFEADATYCHRSLIAKAVEKTSKQAAIHLGKANIKTKHPESLNQEFA